MCTLWADQTKSDSERTHGKAGWHLNFTFKSKQPGQYSAQKWRIQWFWAGDYKALFCILHSLVEYHCLYKGTHPNLERRTIRLTPKKSTSKIYRNASRKQSCLSEVFWKYLKCNEKAILEAGLNCNYSLVNEYLVNFDVLLSRVRLWSQEGAWTEESTGKATWGRKNKVVCHSHIEGEEHLLEGLAFGFLGWFYTHQQPINVSTTSFTEFTIYSLHQATISVCSASVLFSYRKRIFFLFIIIF